MSDNNNVIDFKSGQQRVQAHIAEEQARTQEEIAADKALSIEAHLQVIDVMRNLVAQGKLEGMIVVARHPDTGLFFTDIVFPHGQADPGEAIAYVGILEMLKGEMVEVATMAPTITSDGKIFDPSMEPEEFF